MRKPFATLVNVPEVDLQWSHVSVSLFCACEQKNNIFSARTFSFLDFFSMLPVLWFSITPFWPAVRHLGVLGRIQKCLETSRALSLCTSSLRSLPVEAYSTQTSAQKHRSKKKLVGPYIILCLKFTAPCYSLCLLGRKVFTHTFDLGVLFFMYIVSRAEKGVLWEKQALLFLVHLLSLWTPWTVHLVLMLGRRLHLQIGSFLYI